MKRFIALITQAADMLGIVCLGGMSLVTLIAVFFRYILNSSLPWAEELTRYLFIVTTYMGISVVMARDEHLKMEILASYSGKVMSCILNILSAAFSVIFFLWITKLGFDMTIKVYKINQTAVAFPLHLWIVWAVMVMSFIITSIHSINVLYLSYIKLFNKNTMEHI